MSFDAAELRLSLLPLFFSECVNTKQFLERQVLLKKSFWWLPESNPGLLGHASNLGHHSTDFTQSAWQNKKCVPFIIHLFSNFESGLELLQHRDFPISLWGQIKVKWKGFFISLYVINRECQNGWLVVPGVRYYSCKLKAKCFFPLRENTVSAL